MRAWIPARSGSDSSASASFSLDIEIFAYVFAGDWGRFLEIQQELLLRVMETIDGAGTTIAFPSQTLHIAGQVRNPETGKPV